MEHQETISSFAPGSRNGNQHEHLSFSGTSYIAVPESSESLSNVSNTNNNADKQDAINSVKTPGESEMLNNSKTGIDTHPILVNTNDSRKESQGNSQSLTTTNDNVDANGQYMNMFDYSYQLLEKLISITNELKPVLVNNYIVAEDADFLLKNFQIAFSQHSKLMFQKPLETLADILQHGSDILYGSGQAYNAHLPGEESNETMMRRTSEPIEDNTNQLNEQFQTTTETVNSILNDNPFASLSSSLSQLLSKARNIVQELEFSELKIVVQPQEFWRKRSLNCLKNQWCPAIQGRHGIKKQQRRYIGIEWSELLDCNSDILFILVQLLAYNNEPHPSNVLVPPGTTIKLPESFDKKKKNDNRRLKLDDLVIKNNHGFDRTTKSILCPVTEKEYKQRKKNLKVIMFRLYKTSEDMTHLEDENEDNEDDISIDDQLLKLCKFRISLCRRTNQGELEYVSSFVDTELIEESKGNEQLAVDSTKVTPRYLCSCGNEIIIVPLNTDSEKNGFVVRLNDEKLDACRIRGVKEKQISFRSIPNKIPGQNYLNAKVLKESISETIKQNHDPYHGLDENQLLNINIPYVEHSDNPHVHQDSDMEAMN